MILNSIWLVADIPDATEFVDIDRARRGHLSLRCPKVPLADPVGTVDVERITAGLKRLYLVTTHGVWEGAARQCSENPSFVVMSADPSAVGHRRCLVQGDGYRFDLCVGQQFLRGFFGSNT